MPISSSPLAPALLALVLTAGEPPSSAPFTIDELPFRIESAGRYVLAGDLVGPPGSNGISILASNVELDLGGHRLEGGEGSMSGIQCAADIERVLIRGGLVTLWGRDGIAMSGCRGVRLERVRALDNGGHGIVLGQDAYLSDCESLFNNGGRGFVLGNDAVLRRCRAAGSEYGGIYAGARAVLQDCIASKHVYGAGIHLGMQAIVRGGQSSDNGGLGLRVGRRSYVAGMVLQGNITGGVDAGTASVLVECTVQNTLDGNGIFAAKDSALRGCRSGRNEGSGFVTKEGVELRACVALDNRRHGIVATTGSLVRDNLCEGSRSGDGLRITGRGAVVSGNRARRNAQADLRIEGDAHQVFANRARKGRILMPATDAGQNAVGDWLSESQAEGKPLANVLLPADGKEDSGD